MKKEEQKTKKKLPILVIISAVLLYLFAAQLLFLVFVSLGMHLFWGYDIPENVNWALDLIFYFLVAAIIIIIVTLLCKRNKIARILSIIALFIMSILNLRAEFFAFDYPPSFMRLAIWGLYFLSAFYLLFSRKVKQAFS